MTYTCIYIYIYIEREREREIEREIMYLQLSCVLYGYLLLFVSSLLLLCLWRRPSRAAACWPTIPASSGAPRRGPPRSAWPRRGRVAIFTYQSVPSLPLYIHIYIYVLWYNYYFWNDLEAETRGGRAHAGKRGKRDGRMLRGFLGSDFEVLWSLELLPRPRSLLAAHSLGVCSGLVSRKRSRTAPQKAHEERRKTQGMQQHRVMFARSSSVFFRICMSWCTHTYIYIYIYTHIMLITVIPVYHEQLSMCKHVSGAGRTELLAA